MHLTVKVTLNNVEVVSPATTLGDTTSGRATIYRIENIPEGVGQTKVLQVLRHIALPWNRFQVDWSEIGVGVNLVFSDQPAQPIQNPPDALDEFFQEVKDILS